jgi:hypothetical protein
MRIAAGHLGLGQVAQANPNAGTYSDLNCPTSCFVLGNGLDMSILGQECWPCHNTCPAGTVWDTTNLQCSASPASVNPVVPVTPANPFQPFLDSIGNYLPWVVIGLVAIVVLPVVLKK